MKKGLNSLKSIKRKRVSLNKENLVTFKQFSDDQPLPLVAEPTTGDVSLPQWVGDNRAMLKEKINKHGAMLFRGFKVDALDGFQDSVSALSGDLLTYMERSSPRHAVKDKVYTSTDYPPNHPIFLHNEQSYNLNWCRMINFYCDIEPGGNGQTPLADTRNILKRIDPELVARFKDQGYIYQRNFGDGFGLTWQEAFQTEDRATVERYCKENAIEFEWKPNNRLRTKQYRKALHLHPETGEQVWFNHITFFHVTTLPDVVRDNLLSEFPEEELPNQTFFGNGDSIPHETVDHLRDCYLQEKVMFDWQQGDVLMIDNMLSSHGREPFSGERRILTAMADLLVNRFEDLGKGL